MLDLLSESCLVFLEEPSRELLAQNSIAVTGISFNWNCLYWDFVGTFTGGLLGSTLNSRWWRLGSGCKSLIRYRSLELSFCGATVSGYMDCLQPTEMSEPFLSTPRLMTTHDFDPNRSVPPNHTVQNVK